MANLKKEDLQHQSNELTDDLMETVSGGKTTDIHKFYSASSGKLIGQIVVEDGKVTSQSGTIPEKYKYLLK
ncbi:MAG: hypothetical protein RUMPE_01114 [Eubacteriales bacterium SKADARSKE-1]|nr:hypothetical protein [Eubacteriales bacterium SKADARSKE-1]